MAYSFSQLQTYISCPLKYRFEKIDKIKPDIPTESLHLILGSCVHSVLEHLYKKVSDFVIPQEQELLDLFKELYDKEINRIVEIFDNNPFDQETLDVFYNRGIEYIKYYYDKYSPFDQAKTMKTEMSIAFDIDEGLSFRGKIDRLDIQNETMIINDYKTSKSLPKDGNNTIEDQITLYSIGVQKDYGKQIDKMIGRVIYLHLEMEHQREITEQKIQETKQKYLDIIQDIEKKKTMYDAGDEDAFAPNPGFACDTCIFKQLCPIYKHSYAQDESVDVVGMGQTTIKNLIEEYAKVNEKLKNIDLQKKLISSILTEYASEHGYKKLYGDTKKISLTQKDTYNVAEGKVEDLAMELEKLGILQDVLEISYHKLTKQFKELKIKYDDFIGLVNKNHTTYISRTSDLTEKELEQDLDVFGEEK